MSDPIAWQALLEAFAAGRMTAPDFETAFLDAWRRDRDTGTRTPYAVDVLFYEVDAYCADPALRGPQDIDADGLLAATRQALERFDEPWPKLPRDPADMRHLEAVRRAAAKLFR